MVVSIPSSVSPLGAQFQVLYVVSSASGQMENRVRVFSSYAAAFNFIRLLRDVSARQSAT